MEKQWYRSKTIWSGILLMAYGAYASYSGQPFSPEGIAAILQGFGLIGIRTAID